jgi:hypothetical protein
MYESSDRDIADAVCLAENESMILDTNEFEIASTSVTAASEKPESYPYVTSPKPVPYPCVGSITSAPRD